MTPPSAPHGQKRRLTIAGIVGLFGLFAVLCTLFSLVVTAGIAWWEYRAAHWPETTARIQLCEVRVVGDERPANIIDCRVSYAVDSETVVSSVRSMSSPVPDILFWESDPGQAQRMADSMRTWVDKHPPGTPMAVHYNPARRDEAALAATDMPLGGPQTARNITFTATVAAICAVLLATGFVLRRLSMRRVS